MPEVLAELLTPPVSADPPRKVWTRDECAALEEAGLLDPQEYELVGGDLISKMGKLRPHVISATLLMAWLVQTFGFLFVNSEAPIEVAPEDNPTNQTVPDLIVLRQEQSSYFDDNPGPQDLLLLVEVANTGLVFDLTTKAALYARAGIMEYWVVDVRGRRLIVHREPGNGAYSSVVAFGENESVAPLAAPDSLFAVGGAFPGTAP